MSPEKRAITEEMVRETLDRILNAGSERDFGLLAAIHSRDARYSKFDDTPPYGRQNYSEALMHEESQLATISDLRQRVEDLKVDLFEDWAICTFVLETRGIYVDSYTFEGRPVMNRSRCTYVFVLGEEGLKLIHEHLSRILAPPESDPRASPSRA